MTDTLETRLRDALGRDYSLEHELGGGGMSRVFVATEKSLGRKVVVKVLPPDLAAGVNMERFRREIQLAAQLQHPHVVPLLTSGEKDDLLWFTMPFIEGESLRTLLERHGPLSHREVRRILHNVVDALAYAHSRGVVHRDIKPANILMSGSHAVVTDFGVAKALSAAIPLTGHTTSGMAIGTPAYMAPEQLAADPNADHRVDIYAVGLLAYELLTGKSPFSGSSPQATLAAQLTVRPTAPHLASPDIPGPLSALVMHCLEKDAEKRPQTAQALLEELDRVDAVASGEVRAVGQSATRSGFAIGATVLAIAATIFVVSRSGSDGGRGTSGDTVANAAAAETVVVYRDVPVGADRELGVTLPLVLTPAESLSIAQAIRGERGESFNERLARAGQLSSAALETLDRDSIIAQVSRVFSDSMERAITRMEAALASQPRQRELQALVTRDDGPRAGSPATGARAGGAPPDGGPPRNFPPPPEPPRTAEDSARFRAAMAAGTRTELAPPVMAPPAEGTRRLAIVPFSNRTRRPEFDEFGKTLHVAIEAALQGSRGRLEIVAPAVTTRLLGESLGSAVGVGFSLRAQYVLSGTYFVRNDSLVVIAMLTDAQNGTNTRTHDIVVPLSNTATATPGTSAWVRARLDSMRQADRGRTREFFNRE